MTDFFFVILILAKIWKTTFPKEFLTETWPIIGDYEYIKIVKIKIRNFYSGGILGAIHFPAPSPPPPPPKNAN